MKALRIIQAGLVLLAAAGAARADESLDLRVLSLNCWGIPYITPAWDERIPVIGERVRALAPDIAALQEVWRAADAPKIAAAAGLPHWRYFDDPARSGLLLLSRFPIEDGRLDVFPVGGFGTYVPRGHVDCMAGKSVATAFVRTPLGALPILDTHTIAAHPGRSAWDVDHFTAQRIAQVVVIADAVRGARERSTLPPLLFGDLNAEPDSPEIGLVRGLAGLDDLGPDLGKQRRIDFIFGGARGTTYAIDVRRAVCEELADHALASGRRVWVTDHPYVLAEIRIRPSGAAAVPLAVDTAACRRALGVVTAALDRTVVDVAIAAGIALAAGIGTVLALRRIRRRWPARLLACALGAAALLEAHHAVLARPNEAAVLRATAARLEALSGAAGAGAERSTGR